MLKNRRKRGIANVTLASDMASGVLAGSDANMMRSAQARHVTCQVEETSTSDDRYTALTWCTVSGDYTCNDFNEVVFRAN